MNIAALLPRYGAILLAQGPPSMPGYWLLLSWAYIWMARANWRTLLLQVAWRAFSRALAKTGKRIEARIAIIAMTTSNSISVKPRFIEERIRCLLSKLTEYLRCLRQHNHGHQSQPHRTGND